MGISRRHKSGTGRSRCVFKCTVSESKNKYSTFNGYSFSAAVALVSSNNWICIAPASKISFPGASTDAET